jgi:cytochrome c oxidase subunit 3
MSVEVAPEDSRGAPAPLATGRLGMKLFILALSMLFAASILGYLVVRSRAAAWPPPDMPVLPSTLWISTVIMLASSVTMQAAVRAARTDRRAALKSWMSLTTLLGFAFLASQTVNWFALVAVHLTARVNLYGFTFFILTGLHAAHVVGGIVPLSVVTARSWRGRYSAAFHPGVEYCKIYWHFLDVVWLVMFTALVF